MTALVRYDAMCRAIDAAHAVDEVKDIRDKALAIEVYARQARNVEAEARACEIRLRAERKAGILLREREKAKGAQGNPGGRGAPIVRSHDTTAQSLSDFGISKTQSSRWQKLAAVPEPDFEAALAQPGKPSTNAIITAHAPVEARALCRPAPVDPRALWLWGRLLDFEREGLLAADANELLDGMLAHMRKTTKELAPVVARWLGRIADERSD